ncbi:hypothetical protein ACFLYI_02860 [Chloroflexota bacterium]
MESEKIIREIVQQYGESFNAKTLVLLEHEEQVKDCLRWLDEVKGQTQIIALSPFAIYELDKHDISYRIPEDYYEPGELYHFGLGNYQRIEDFSSLIDKHIHKACPAVAERGIKPALFSIYNMKLIYDAVMIRLFQLSRIFDAEKPDIVFVYSDREYPFGISAKALYFLFDNRESVYTHLLKLHGWKVPVIVLPYIQQPGETHARRKRSQGITKKVKDKLSKWLLLRPELYNLTIAIRNRAWRDFFMRLNGYLTRRKNIPVLLFGGQSNWNDCREELQLAGIVPIFTMPDNLRHWLSEPPSEKMNSRSLLAVWQGLKLDSEFRRFFIWQDIDFFPVLEERLKFLSERLTLACLKAYEEVSEVLGKRDIKAFLASGLSTCTSHSAAQAAHSAGIPVINWQHGSFGYMNQPITIYNDIMGADAFFVFGKGVIEKYAEPAKRLGTRLISVGSTSLEKLGKKKLERRTKKLIPSSSDKKVILYVTTNFYQNTLYISLPPPFSDNHYWHTQRAILDVLAQHQDYTIVVKTHHTLTCRDTPLRWYAREKGFENCRFIKNECSFTDLLPRADVLVIDWPSTVLLQALTTSKPVFVYTGHIHIDNQAQKSLEHRASCHRKLGDFIDALDNFLSGSPIDVDLNDTEFFRKFGTAGGTSGIKSSTALIDIIRNYPK